jgi:glutathione synthase/RimK-type ligase-like ATP-grasp enzyme
MQKIVVLNAPQSWKFDIAGVEVIATNEYLSNAQFAGLKNARVFNLSRDYSYQSQGYYVSLIAEARGHKPLPDVKTLLDLKAPSMVKVVSDNLDELIQRSLKHVIASDFVLNIYFGQNGNLQFVKLSSELYKLFQAPLLRAKFSYNKKWTLQSIKAISLNDIPEEQLDGIRNYAGDYFTKKRYDRPRPDKSVYDIAILYSSEVEAPPSNKQAINKFIEAGEKSGFNVEIITQEDFHRLPSFDALLIRDNTKVNNHTYKFARRAQSEGLAIIDYPDTILKCSNKVYIAELLQMTNLTTPKTMIIHQANKSEVINNLGLPVVLKSPDSTFSLGVKKVETAEELNIQIKRMLEQSDMILGQQYMFTEFDWRIGILDNKAIFACKYYMAKGHWQIYNWLARSKKDITGQFECVPVENVPPAIIKSALKAVAMVYNYGFFGVDIKEVNGKPYIIEINDNPNIDAGVEDQVTKDELYMTIMLSLKNRIEEKIFNGNRKILQAV